MTIADIIYQPVQTMPEALAQEVLDFAEYLKFKWKNSKTTPINRESSNLRELLEQDPSGSRTSQEIDHEFQALTSIGPCQGFNDTRRRY